MICGFVCGIFVIVNNIGKKNSDSSVTIQQGNTLSIISFLILSFIISLIALIYVLRGLPFIWESFSTLLTNSKIFRYIIYGLIYPIISSLFITYSFTDINPFEELRIDVFFVILFITLFVGIIVCLNWTWYINIASYLVNIF